MSNTSVVKVGKKHCWPFALNVMVFSPESGYRVEVVVERSCTKQNETRWKLVFDLFRKKGSEKEFTQLVHVSYTCKKPEEETGIKKMFTEGVSSGQAHVLSNEVYPAAKEVAESVEVTSGQKRKLTSTMSKAVKSFDL